MRTAIHWFRRDLRITDNRALDAAVAGAEQVVCVYILSSWRGVHRWTGSKRQTFLCGCLAALDANLRTIGGRLLIREGDPVDELLRLAAETGAGAIFFNRDPDPHGRAVEARLADRAGRVEIRSFKDAVMHEAGEVFTASGEPFRVFTPYWKAWAKLPKDAPRPRLRRITCPTNLPSLPLPEPSRWGLERQWQILEPGEKAARARLKQFVTNGLASYGKRRDIPAGQTTSRISQDLRFGLLSIRETFALCQGNDLPAEGRASAARFISELVWREFYMAILAHYPEVLEREFNPRYAGMRWPGKREALRRWQEGQTGFPIVDAAMRQLALTGFIHNRARMIVAMFLTKDLHIDWREGERHFMQHLVDGEIASNNGGWQWSAGTGADAAPYFRIQNPWTQTKRYDPDGEYIREWVPELRDVPARFLCEPPPDGRSLAPGYPGPIVDHARAREITLRLFKVSESPPD